MSRLFIIYFTLLSSFLLAQKESFKVMSYNLMYYKTLGAPCNSGLTFSEKDNNFRIIFEAVLPDILCVNELGAYADNSAAESVLDDVLNTSGRNNYTSAAYSNNSFSEITNMLFYDSSRFVLKSQSYIDKGINNAPLVRVIDFYRLYYKDPGLSGGNVDTVFTTVVVAHLKAGNATGDVSDREAAAEAIMEYLEEEVPDDNIMLCGDLNVYGSTEGAYQALTGSSTGSKHLNDPLGFGGSWNNNSLFAPIHTQSTHSSSSGCYSGGGMDDRFDFILVSDAILSGSSKLTYIEDTYEAFGQDGNHFNSSINSGNTAVSADVADALYTFSDHLPVVAEFEVEVSTMSLPGERQLTPGFTFSNPVNNTLYLKRDVALKELEVMVFDLAGRQVFREVWEEKKEQLHISSSSWPPGMYLLQLRDEESDASNTQKLIKR